MEHGHMVMGTAERGIDCRVMMWLGMGAQCATLAMPTSTRTPSSSSNSCLDVAGVVSPLAPLQY